jgi:hypothetical protein
LSNQRLLEQGKLTTDGKTVSQLHIPFSTRELTSSGLTMKRKHSVTIDSANDGRPLPDLPLESRKRRPQVQTSFLSLPNELRQAILLQSHEENFPYGWHFVWNGIHNTWFQLFRRRFNDWNPRFQPWANVLRQVHVDIIEDVNYVEGKWMEYHQKLLMDAEIIWREKVAEAAKA